jgi:hypothetical protein
MIQSRRESIPGNQRGSAMLAALCLAMVFALCLSSYIALCYTSLKMSTRNLMGSHCIELAETGLEQALYSQNNWDWSAPWIVNSAAATANLTLPAFHFENGATGQVTVYVVENSPQANWAQVTSSATVSLPDGTTVTRTLQCQCQPVSTFVNAAAATAGRMTFAQGGKLDSYYSSQGPYQAPGGFSAVVLSGSTPALYPTVLLNSAVVDGYAVGVGPDSVSYSNSAQVVGPTTPNGTNVDPSRILTSAQAYQPQLPENLPATVPVPPVNAIYTSQSLGTPGATAPTVVYASDVNLSGAAQLQIMGPVILVIQNGGNLSVSSSAQIVIANTQPPAMGGGGPNVSLEVHLENGNMNLDGGGIVNNTMTPERLTIIGTQVTTGPRLLEMGTTTPFYGVIYFPNAPLTVNNNPTIYGSLVANSITFNGSPTVHYDMSLRTPDGRVGDTAFSSVETPQPVGAISPGSVVAPITVVPGTLVEVPAVPAP